VASLTERYDSKIVGVLSCFDRVVVQGTLPSVCYPQGMERYLSMRNIRFIDYPRFAEPFREQIRENAVRLAREAQCEIEFVRKSSFRKESRIAEVLAVRGSHPGLVHVLSAMEGCISYQYRFDKGRQRNCLKYDSGKCLHYYFYFIDAELGLCYVRVPTWCPFRLQLYYNGHNHLATRLASARVSYRMVDNAFVEVGDIVEAQRLADEVDVARLHAKFDRYAALCCPAAAALGQHYHWSLMQVEYSTDLIFRSQADLKPMYESITRTAVHAVKADNIATFLSRRINGQSKDEIGNDYSIRIEGTRIKHHMGPASIKMYDKRSIVLRIETTINDVSFFSHHRKVEQRDGTSVFKLAPLKKSIYSLLDLKELMSAANRRYLEFISALDDTSPATKALRKVCEPAEQNGRRYRGVNFFSSEDERLLTALVRGEFNITGLRNRDLQPLLPDKKPSWISRCLKRLRVHGLIKSIGHRYKYYLTELGRRVVVAGLKLREGVVVPSLVAEAR
jgi:hypothetical protein